MEYLVCWVQNEVSEEAFQRFKFLLKNFLKHSNYWALSKDDAYIQNKSNISECFLITRTLPAKTFFKTTSHAFYSDLLKVLVLMYECGMANDLICDDKQDFWDALHLIQTQQPLQRYSQLMRLFNKTFLEDPLSTIHQPVLELLPILVPAE